jgi:hypothetical protein
MLRGGVLFRPINTFKATAYVEYYAPQGSSTPQRQSFGAFGILHRLNRQECYTAIDLERLKARGIALSPEVERDLQQKLQGASPQPAASK